MSQSSPPEIPRIFAKRPPRGRSKRLAAAVVAVLGLPLAALAYKIGAPRLSALFKNPPIRAFMMMDPEGRRSLRLDMPAGNAALTNDQPAADSTKLIPRDTPVETPFVLTQVQPQTPGPPQTAWTPPSRVAPPAPLRPGTPQPAAWPHLRPGALEEINDQENRAMLGAYPDPGTAPSSRSPSPRLRIVPWKEAARTAKPTAAAATVPPPKKRADFVPLQPNPSTPGPQTSFTPAGPSPARWVVQPSPTAAPAPSAVVWGAPSSPTP